MWKHSEERQGRKIKHRIYISSAIRPNTSNLVKTIAFLVLPIAIYRFNNQFVIGTNMSTLNQIISPYSYNCSTSMLYNKNVVQQNNILYSFHKLCDHETEMIVTQRGTSQTELFAMYSLFYNAYTQHFKAKATISNKSTFV